MLHRITNAARRTYRRHRPGPALGEILATNNLPKPPSPPLLPPPVLERTEAAWANMDKFQQAYIDPLIDRMSGASGTFFRSHIFPRLPATVRAIRWDNLPIVGDARKQYAQMLFGEEADEEPTPEEQALQRQLFVCLTTFGFNSIAAVVAPPMMLLSLPGLLYLVEWFFRGSYQELVYERRFNLMSFASVGVAGTLVLGQFWAVSFWSILFVPANIMIAKTRRKSKQQLVNILGETPRFVWVQCNGSEIQIPFEHLQEHDVIVVGAGETIPVDGTILNGTASIDQHMLTGEAQPAEKTSGDVVFASTIVLAGRLHIQVEQAGDATVAAQIGKILAQTANYETTTQLRGWQLAESLVTPMMVLGGVTLPLLGPTSAVAVISCAIGVNMRVSSPLSVLNFLHIATEHGILIKDGRVLELLPQVDTVVFDKTGTLTNEQPHVGAVHGYGAYSENDIVQYAASAETRQSHPIARAILHEASLRQLPVLPLDDAAYQPGFGLCVRLTDRREIRVGSARFMQQEGIALPLPALPTLESCHDVGYSLVFVAVDDALIGAIELHPTIRAEIADVVQQLHHRGLHLVIISGDHQTPTQRLAYELGIDEYFAEVLPQEKAKLVEMLQQRGRTVCFVGDGINDSIALKQAQVSISLRGATTIAMDTAQVVLLEESLAQLPTLFDLAHQMKRTMHGNFLASVVPGMINIGSVYLLHSGILIAYLLGMAGWSSGIVNAMFPLLRHTLPKLEDRGDGSLAVAKSLQEPHP